MAGKKLPIGSNSFGSWQKVHGRYGDEVWPVIKNSFELKPNSRIFAIGSCFAVNIAKYLHFLGYDVPSYRPDLYMNRHNPVQIYEELVFARENYLNGGFDPQTAERFCINTDGGGCYELDRPHFLHVDKNEFLKRRKELYEIFGCAFDADYAVITLGMIEGWHYTVNDVHLAKMPLSLGQKFGWDDFKVERLTFARSYGYVRSSIEIIRELNPDCKVLITTSPIPMSRTFTDNDIIIANNHSKSILRGVCAEISNDIEGVDYFPSYEMVTLSKGAGVWEEDKQHVTSSFVGKIVGHVVSSYCPGIPQEKLDECRGQVAFAEKRYADAAQLLKGCGGEVNVFVRAKAQMLCGDRAGAVLSLAELFGSEPSGEATGRLSGIAICRKTLEMLENGESGAKEYLRNYIDKFGNEKGSSGAALGILEENQDIASAGDLRSVMNNEKALMEGFYRLFFDKSALCLNSGIFGTLIRDGAEKMPMETDSLGSDVFSLCEPVKNAGIFGCIRAFMPQPEVRRLFLGCLFRGVVNVMCGESAAGLKLIGGEYSDVCGYAVFGTGKAGSAAYAELCVCGITPVCFIDDNRSNALHMDIPVMTRGEFQEKYSSDSHFAVVRGPMQSGDLSDLSDKYKIIDMNRLEEFNRSLFGGRYIRMPQSVK